MVQFATLMLALIALGTGIGIYWLFPDATERWYRRYSMVSDVAIKVFAVLTGLVLLGTPALFLQLLGFLVFVGAALWLAIDLEIDAI